jgi:hypothetical protein
MDPSTPLGPLSADAPGRSSRLAGFAVVVLVNAVPLAGVLRYGWSVTNVLLLYWVENLLIAVCTCIRIAAHRRLTRKRGHWRGDQLGIRSGNQPLRSGLLGEYATGAFVFTFAHGIFVAVIVFAMGRSHAAEPIWRLSPTAVGIGVLVIAAMLAIELLADLATIRSRSFAWISDLARRRMGRVVVLHLAIIFGILAMVMTDSPLGILYVLVGLKALAELGGVAAGKPKAAAATTAAVEPPAWALKVADRIGRDKGGAAMLKARWKQDTEAERRQAIADEEAMPT